MDDRVAAMVRRGARRRDRLSLLDGLMSKGFEGFDARPNLAARFKAVNGAGKKP